jgi:hypothetical protein
MNQLTGWINVKGTIAAKSRQSIHRARVLHETTPYCDEETIAGTENLQLALRQSVSNFQKFSVRIYLRLYLSASSAFS